MKTESNVRPSALVIEEHGDAAEVIFRENITEETKEQDGETTVVYTYDEYRLIVPNRERRQKHNGLKPQQKRNTTRWRRKSERSATRFLWNQTPVCVLTEWGLPSLRVQRSPLGLRSCEESATFFPARG